MNQFGQSNFFFIAEGDQVFTVSDGTNNEELHFDDAANTFNPAPTEFSTGPQTMYYRTVYFGAQDNTCLVDVDGKLIRWDWGDGNPCLMNMVDAGPPAQISDGSIEDWEAWGEAFGGITEGSVIQSADSNGSIVLKCNDGLLCLNTDWFVVSGELTQWNG